MSGLQLLGVAVLVVGAAVGVGVLVRGVGWRMVLSALGVTAIALVVVTAGACLIAYGGAT